MLTGEEIIAQVNTGTILISPFHIQHVGPNSVDLTLSSTLLRYEDPILDMKVPPRVREIEMDPNEGFVLQANAGYLGLTQEIAGSEYFVPMVDGRSSIGRLFLDVHATAGRGDLGFVNRWTLELTAKDRPIRIYPGVRIAQIYFFETVGERNRFYKGKYNTKADEKPVASRLFMDFLDDT